MAMPLPHSDHWTAADLDQMPDDGLRYEVLNGQLVVNAAPKPKHQWLIQSLFLALQPVVPAEMITLLGTGVLIGSDEPIPDLVIADRPIDMDGRGVPAAQVRVAVEVVSKSTTFPDRMVKPVIYASAGIEHYWRFEINPFKGQLPGEALPVLFAYTLGAEGEYVPTHRASAGSPVTLRAPFEVTFDPGALLPR
ncbi:Uma2 family endonuclease [Nocardia sp. NPDC058379]|uniref:Uma2 family endonuclease n=1 Tax=unclassified Nocardia TaxID=2637762 RepID=UPI00364E289E